MPPSLALFLWLVLLLLLLRFDPARDPETSLALWVPVIWLFIDGSRLPSQWLGGQVGAAVANALEEGNSLDRAIWSALILLAIIILVSRSFQWGDFFARNLALVTYLSFALFSIFWSDFPFVSFKRWFRDLGSYLMIFVVLSDPRPLEAVRTVLRRLCYLLVPLSILLIKYYIGIGRHYDEWTGATAFVGAATSKNMLGVLCLVSGLFFFWDTVTRWSDRNEQRTRWIFVNLSFTAMTLWLLIHAHSATSTLCLALGCLVIAAAHSNVGQRHASLLKVVIPACFCLYLILGFGFGMNTELAGAVGRDPTFTGRTKIWDTLLGMHTDPLIGTGYGSFWLGPRLNLAMQKLGNVTEAHNGYLEIYLNLGIIGVFLLIVFLIVSYRSICQQLASKESFASLALALWTVLLFYMVTEAALRGGLLSVTFMLGAITVSAARDTMPYQETQNEHAFDSGTVPIAHEAIFLEETPS